MRLDKKISKLYNEVKVPNELYHIDFKTLDEKLRSFKTIIYLCFTCAIFTGLLCFATYIIN